MWIVLAVLKWIGILLAGTIGLVLLLTLLVLAVPVRYRVMGERDSEEGVRYAYCVSWFLHLVTIRKKKTSGRVRLYVLGIPVRTLAGGDVPKKDAKRSGKKAETGAAQENEKGSADAKEKEMKETVEKTESAADFSSADVLLSAAKKRKKKRRKIKKKQRGQKKSFSFEKISSIINFVGASENKRAFSFLFRECRALLRYLFPRRIKGTLIFGTGDPAYTGLLTGGLCLFPVVYREGVRIVPDFEQKIFQMDGSIKGRLRVIYLVRLCLRFYRNEDIQRFLKQRKEGGSNHGRS